MSTVYVRFPLRSAAPRERAPLLERLLFGAVEPARSGGRYPRGRHWRDAALALLVGSGVRIPPLAPLGLLAEAGADAVTSACAWVCFATPVHCAATMTSVRMAPAGILSLARTEAAELVRDFDRVFHDSQHRLVAGRSGTLYMAFAAPLEVHTHDPGDALDQDVWDFLPAGADAAALRAFMSEIELWLFDHAINRGREARALAPITGLWLWGGGAPLIDLPPLAGWTAGTDLFFASLPLSDGASGVVVAADAPGTAGWHTAEARWLQPALRDLGAGRLAAIELSAGERCYRVERHWRWHLWRRRIWRRAAPWWECFE